MTDKKPLTKSQLFASLAEQSALTKDEVATVFDNFYKIIEHELQQGAGQITLPGLIKIEKQQVAAKPAQKDVKNPFTGLLQDRPEKPAFNRIKVRPLKGLKDMVQ